MKFTKSEKSVISDALDSYAYWGVAGPHERRNGYVETDDEETLEYLNDLRQLEARIAAGRSPTKSELATLRRAVETHLNDQVLFDVRESSPGTSAYSKAEIRAVERLLTKIHKALPLRELHRLRHG